MSTLIGTRLVSKGPITITAGMEYPLLIGKWTIKASVNTKIKFSINSSIDISSGGYVLEANSVTCFDVQTKDTKLKADNDITVWYDESNSSSLNFKENSSGDSGSGSSGDASASNQLLGLGLLGEIQTALENPLPIVPGVALEAKQDTGNASLAAILTALGGLLKVSPSMTSSGHLELATSATSGAYSTFSSQVCKQITLFNNTGVLIGFKQNNTGPVIPLFREQPLTLFGVTNTNQISIIRADLSTTPVTVQLRWEA